MSDTIFKNLLSSGNKLLESAEPGKPISIEELLECHEHYKLQMRDHAFREVAGVPVFINVLSRKITWEELFVGKELYNWIVETAGQLDSSPNAEHLEMSLVLGMYTESFLRKHIPDTTLRASKANRITVFIVIRKIGLELKNLAEGNAAAYDLGGLNP